MKLTVLNHKAQVQENRVRGVWQREACFTPWLPAFHERHPVGSQTSCCLTRNWIKWTSDRLHRLETQNRRPTPPKPPLLSTACPGTSGTHIKNSPHKSHSKAGEKLVPPPTPPPWSIQTKGGDPHLVVHPTVPEPSLSRVSTMTHHGV